MSGRPPYQVVQSPSVWILSCLKRASRFQMSSADAARGESYQQLPNFHCERGERTSNTFSEACPSLTPETKRVGEKRNRKKWMIKCVQFLITHAFWLCSSVWALPCSRVGLAPRGCLCLFNYCNSGPPAECLHLPLSEVRGGKILRAARSCLPNRSERDPYCYKSPSVDKETSSTFKSPSFSILQRKLALTVHASNSKMTQFVDEMVFIPRTLF